MTKNFALNDNNKIEISKDELKKLLDEIYWEGYRARPKSWVYTTPSWITAPSWITCDDSSLTVSTAPLNSTTTTNTTQINTKS